MAGEHPALQTHPYIAPLDGIPLQHSSTNILLCAVNSKQANPSSVTKLILLCLCNSAYCTLLLLLCMPINFGLP